MKYTRSLRLVVVYGPGMVLDLDVRSDHLILTRMTGLAKRLVFNQLGGILKMPPNLTHSFSAI